MNTLSKESIRVKNKNKGKRKKKKKVYSRNSVERSSYEHIGLSSNNTNESFLSESSNTLNDDIIGLSKQRLKYRKNLTIGHLNINSLRNTSQKASKCTVKVEPKPEEDSYST